MEFRTYHHIERFGMDEVDFKILQRTVIAKVKEVKPDIFG